MNSNGFVSSIKPKNSWFCFKHNGRLAVEAFIKGGFIWRKITEASIAKDQAVVHAPGVSDQVCSLTDTIKHQADDKGLPIGLPRNW